MALKEAYKVLKAVINIIIFIIELLLDIP